MSEVVSPYRVCPIGAHSDHQGGPVLGMTVNAHTRLTFEASDRPWVELTSANFPGTVEFSIGERAPSALPEWGRYAHGAVAALGHRLPARPRGFVGRVQGTLPGGGLSSSASVLLAYVEAMAHVNDVALTPEDKMQLALRAEREYVGMRVGILDPGIIVAGQKDRLIALDTETSSFVSMALGTDAPEYRILVVFSGTPRHLAATPYNDRVEECFEAVRVLAEENGPRPRKGVERVRR